MATEDVAYVLDQVTLSDDEDDEFEYHEELTKFCTSDQATLSSGLLPVSERHRWG